MKDWTLVDKIIEKKEQENRESQLKEALRDATGMLRAIAEGKQFNAIQYFESLNQFDNIVKGKK